MRNQRFYLYPMTLFSLLLGISSANAASLSAQRLLLQELDSQLSSKIQLQATKQEESNSATQKNKGLWDDIKGAGEDVGEFGEEVGEDAADVGEDIGEGAAEAGEDTLEFGEEVGEDAADVGEDIGEDAEEVGEDAEEVGEDVID